MIDLENKKERDKLIDDYFNKGKECDIKEVYQAIVNSTGDLEYEVDKLKSILKQVREYIEENQEEHKYTDRGGFTYIEGHFLRDSDTLLEILDKGE